jgi:hypothetical protein
MPHEKKLEDDDELETHRHLLQLVHENTRKQRWVGGLVVVFCSYSTKTPKDNNKLGAYCCLLWALKINEKMTRSPRLIVVFCNYYFFKKQQWAPSSLSLSVHYGKNRRRWQRVVVECSGCLFSAASWQKH